MLDTTVISSLLVRAAFCMRFNLTLLKEEYEFLRHKAITSADSRLQDLTVCFLSLMDEIYVQLVEEEINLEPTTKARSWLSKTRKQKHVQQSANTNPKLQQHYEALLGMCEKVSQLKRADKTGTNNFLVVWDRTYNLNEYLKDIITWYGNMSDC